MGTRDLKSSYFIGDLEIGQVFNHGAVQITPLRNNAYINIFSDNCIIPSNNDLSKQLGYTDPELSVKKKK